jgi:hypothetical protein
MPSQRKKVVKKAKPRVRQKKTTKEPVLVKIDFWAIAAKEVYDACVRAGFDEGTAMAFAMDRSSYPDWIVDPKDPIKNPLDDFEEDDE